MPASKKASTLGPMRRDDGPRGGFTKLPDEFQVQVLDHLDASEQGMVLRLMMLRSRIWSLPVRVTDLQRGWGPRMTRAVLQRLREVGVIQQTAVKGKRGQYVFALCESHDFSSVGARLRARNLTRAGVPYPVDDTDALTPFAPRPPRRHQQGSKKSTAPASVAPVMQHEIVVESPVIEAPLEDISVENTVITGSEVQQDVVLEAPPSMPVELEQPTPEPVTSSSLEVPKEPIVVEMSEEEELASWGYGAVDELPSVLEPLVVPVAPAVAPAVAPEVPSKVEPTVATGASNDNEAPLPIEVLPTEEIQGSEVAELALAIIQQLDPNDTIDLSGVERQVNKLLQLAPAHLCLAYLNQELPHAIEEKLSDPENGPRFPLAVVCSPARSRAPLERLRLGGEPDHDKIAILLKIAQTHLPDLQHHDAERHLRSLLDLGYTFEAAKAYLQTKLPGIIREKDAQTDKAPRWPLAVACKAHRARNFMAPFDSRRQSSSQARSLQSLLATPMAPPACPPPPPRPLAPLSGFAPVAPPPMRGAPVAFPPPRPAPVVAPPAPVAAPRAPVAAPRAPVAAPSVAPTLSYPLASEAARYEAGVMTLPGPFFGPNPNVMPIKTFKGFNYRYQSTLSVWMRLSAAVTVSANPAEQPTQVVEHTCYRRERPVVPNEGRDALKAFLNGPSLRDASPEEQQRILQDRKLASLAALADIQDQINKHGK